MPDEKQLEHERFCGARLLEILKIRYSDLRHGNQHQEPDLIFTLPDDIQLGLEVTSAYPEDNPEQPNSFAKRAWKFVRKPTFDEQGIHRMGAGTDPDKHLAREIKGKLAQKCQKKYLKPAEIWLVIYAHAHPVVFSNELDTALDVVQIPELNPFRRIFILHVTSERGGGYRARQLFPEGRDYFSIVGG
jgi:hypothetical protein